MSAVYGSVLMFSFPFHIRSLSSFPSFTGTSIVQVTATDADDPTYGNSARLVYTLVQGQPHFSVDPQTGKSVHFNQDFPFSPATAVVFNNN